MPNPLPPSPCCKSGEWHHHCASEQWRHVDGHTCVVVERPGRWEWHVTISCVDVNGDALDERTAKDRCALTLRAWARLVDEVEGLGGVCDG